MNISSTSIYIADPYLRIHLIRLVYWLIGNLWWKWIRYFARFIVWIFIKSKLYCIVLCCIVKYSLVSHHIPVRITVSIPACHAGDQGLISDRENSFRGETFVFKSNRCFYVYFRRSKFIVLLNSIKFKSFTMFLCTTSLTNL